MLVTCVGHCSVANFHLSLGRPHYHKIGLGKASKHEQKLGIGRCFAPKYRSYGGTRSLTNALGSIGSYDDEVVKLRSENADLRFKLSKLLENLDEENREIIVCEHHRITLEGIRLGEEIPILDEKYVCNKPYEYEKIPEVKLDSSVRDDHIDLLDKTNVKEHNDGKCCSTNNTKEKVPDEPVLLSNVSDISCTVEVEKDESIVFRFGSSFQGPISNNARASQMDVNGAKDGSIKSSGDLSVNNTNTSDLRSSEIGQKDPKVVQETKHIQADRTGKERISSSSADLKLQKNNEMILSRDEDIKRSATKRAQSHVPVQELESKRDSLFVTVPEVPVAGAWCMLYFNRGKSDALRNRPHLELMAGFNEWEIRPSEAEDRSIFSPVHDGPVETDFWKTIIYIPDDAYEIQFVIGDGDGTFDNNHGENYHLQVQGGMTRDLWHETAAERAEAQFLAQKEEERLHAERETAKREEIALENDKSEAQSIIQEIITCSKDWLEGSVGPEEGLPSWHIRGTSSANILPGKKIRIQYNRMVGPLKCLELTEKESVMVKIGYNNWNEHQTLVMSRVSGRRTLPEVNGESEWWETEMLVPVQAIVLNFVFLYNDIFDNNDGNDYKVALAIPQGKSLDTWINGLFSKIAASITSSRHLKEEEERAREETKRLAREAVLAKAKQVRRRQMRHMLFTVPELPSAGDEVTVHYNPSNTNLNGSENIYIIGSFNRWHHREKFGPLKLKPEAEGEHCSVRIKVPKDAFSLDFVFTDSANSDGRFDNRSGLDYHVPVQNAVVKETPLYVAHIAVEMAPICKVGGLGDVVTALGRAVQESGHLVEVILPRYDFFLASPLLGATQYETDFEWAGTRIFVSSCIVEGLRCWFIEPSNGMFSGDVVYRGGTQDPGRFAFFSRAALEFLLRTQRQPDILHCHDWSTAEVARAYWTEYHHFGLWKPKVVFTIHNLNYGIQAIGEAAHHCQKFTTVSPTYAWEIGDSPAIAPHAAKLMGIRNGIDVDIWNPETDMFLPRGYVAETCKEGKAAARAELRNRLGLTGWNDRPVVAIVSRLTKQKGTHLIAHSAWRTLDRGGQFVLLGSAPDPKIQAEFDGLSSEYGGENAAFCFAFDEPLSHLIYAAADIVVVPSMFEPCGLTQMIAMRYGAIPVVRHTGGLKDTVFDVDHDQERAAWELEGSTDWERDNIESTNGFAFEGTEPEALDYALNRAFDAFYNANDWFRSLQERVMKQDWSWNRPGEDYIELYHAAMK